MKIRPIAERRLQSVHVHLLDKPRTKNKFLFEESGNISIIDWVD